MSNPVKRFNCENCGMFDQVEFYEICGGIKLCEDCADLPVRQIRKGDPDEINWVMVDDEYFPPNYPVVKRYKESNGLRRKKSYRTT